MTELRKRAAKNICKDMLRKEKAYERRNDHVIKKLKGVDDKIEHSRKRNLRNENLRKVRSETDRPTVNDFDDKKMLDKLLHTENLKRKEVEEEEKMTELRKRAAKNICEDMLRKDNEAYERRNQEIERSEQTWKVDKTNLYKLHHKMANKQDKKFSLYGNEMEERGYGHRDGLGYSWGGGFRKKVLIFY